MTTPSNRATQQVLRQIDRDRDEAIALLRGLVARQAEGEPAVQAAVAERLTAIGASVEMLRYRPSDVPVIGEFASSSAQDEGSRGSIIARFPQRAGGRSLLLFAHPDSEPVGDLSQWPQDAFAGSILDGRLHGWGVADDLAGVAASVAAVAAIGRAGITLAGAVMVASTPSKRHARGIAAALHHGVDADGALYLHPAESGAGMAEIKAFASGLLEFTIEIEGKAPATAEPAHTAFAHRAVHPLDKALPIIAALRQLDEERGRRIRHPLLEAAVGRSTNMLLTSLKFGEAGSSNRVPEWLSLTGSISFPPFEALDAVKAEVEAALDRVIAADPYLVAHRPVLRWLSGVTGSEVDAFHPLYGCLSGAIRSIAGIEPRINPMHTSSDIRNPLVQKGIPALGFGALCGDLTQAGGHGEWVDVEDYVRMIKVTAACIIDWCGTVDESPAAAGVPGGARLPA